MMDTKKNEILFSELQSFFVWIEENKEWLHAMDIDTPKAIRMFIDTWEGKERWKQSRSILDQFAICLDKKYFKKDEKEEDE